jgi:aspartyl-tRNA(Asn)/glutamyl-tRNA(Gln) amidotransferase subunit C
MKLSREEVVHIAALVRMSLSEAEIEKAREQLSVILENFEVLKEIDTTGVPPTAQAISLQNVIRDDIACDSLPEEQILANAPDREENLFKLRPVLE